VRNPQRKRTRLQGTTLTELSLAVVIAMVITIVGWAAVEMGHSEILSATARADSNRSVFAVLRSIQENILRASAIEVPDPDYPELDSIQMTVPTETGTVRRAFRLDDHTLVIDYKDEAAAPYGVFEPVEALSFTALDAPTNSLIEVTCRATGRNETINMRTVIRRRN